MPKVYEKRVCLTKGSRADNESGHDLSLVQHEPKPPFGERPKTLSYRERSDGSRVEFFENTPLCTRLREIGEMWFRVAACLDELDQRGLTCLEFGKRQPVAKEFMP
jgi:hypothetical protein